MTRISLPSLSSALALVLALAPAQAALNPPPASRWIPQEAVLVAEFPQPDVLLDPLLSTNFTEAIAALPAYQHQAATDKFKEFLSVIKLIEIQLHTDWKTGLRTLLGGGVTFAAGHGGHTLLCVDSRDASMLDRLHEGMRTLATGEAQKQNQPERVQSKEYRGVTGWTFGPKEAHVILSNRLMIANAPEVLMRVVDLSLDPEGANLAGRPPYQEACHVLGSDAVGRIFVDLQALRQLPNFLKGLSEDSDPMGALLTASLKDALAQANWLAIGLYVRDGALTFRAVSDAPKPEASSPAAFACPQQPGQGALPNLKVADTIASLSLFRDLHGFYAAKDDLFPERTSGLIFFENMMGIFFSGLDLTEEVLGETEPQVRVVVARQDYDPAVGTPSIQLPAFAFVFQLRQPETFGQVVEEAWQKAIGLVNFTRGQKALPGLIIDRARHQNSDFTLAYYRPPPEAPQPNLHLRYNFRPTLARSGPHVVLSSTDQLATQLLTALQQETRNPKPPLPQIHSLLEISAAPLSCLLEGNRESLIRQNIVDKGNTREQAEGEIGLLFNILDFFRQAKLSSGYALGHPETTLTLSFRVPQHKTVHEP